MRPASRSAVRRGGKQWRRRRKAQMQSRDRGEPSAVCPAQCGEQQGWRQAGWLLGQLRWLWDSRSWIHLGKGISMLRMALAVASLGGKGGGKNEREQQEKTKDHNQADDREPPAGDA